MDKKPIVFVSGNFNILHPGHLRLLRFAKASGDRLIVGLESDRLAGTASYVPESLRLLGLQSISLIDEVVIIDEPITEFISRLRPDIVVKGKEHELQFNPELAAIEEYGGRLIFSSGEAVFSSLDLIRKEFQEQEIRSISLPQEYLTRRHISRDRLAKLVESFSKLKVCVIGDLIIDEYITCQPLGMSQEDPTIVVTPLSSTRFIGGAGIVAAHAAGLGAKVDFFSVTGSDASREFALEGLSTAQVNAHLFIDDSRPTTLKQRYRSNEKSLFRVSHLHQSGISIKLQQRILKEIKQALQGADLLVFSDFNYGCLPQALVEQIIDLVIGSGVILAADSQSSSQTGDISRFKGMDLITPTEREARISTRNREDGLVILAEKLRQDAVAKNIFLKLGEEGLFIHAESSEDIGTLLNDRISALNNIPKDVAGAGDSLLITSAMSLASDGNIWEAACLGSLAAAVQVGRVGNTPLTIEELLREIR
jgi:rfaE bifunctional protein kinase chain/domain